MTMLFSAVLGAVLAIVLFVTTPLGWLGAAVAGGVVAGFVTVLISLFVGGGGRRR